jgi:hypothetical protein
MERDTLAELAQRRGAAAYVGLRALTAIAGRTGQPDRWIRAAQSLRESGEVSRDLSWLLMHPFVETLTWDTWGLSDDSGQAVPSMYSQELDPATGRIRREFPGRSVQRDYLLTIGEPEWASLVSDDLDGSRHVIPQAERDFTGCCALELKADLPLLDREPISDGQFDQLVAHYLTRREANASPSLWPSLVMRLPAEADGEHDDGREWTAFLRALDGPHSESVRAVTRLSSLVPFLPDLARWFGAAARISFDEPRLTNQCLWFLDHFVEVVVDGLVANGAERGSEDAGDSRRALKVAYLRSMGEDTWAELVGSDDEALRHTLRTVVVE